MINSIPNQHKDTICYECKKDIEGLMYSIALEYQSDKGSRFCKLDGQQCIIAFCLKCWRSVAGIDWMFNPALIREER